MLFQSHLEMLSESGKLRLKNVSTIAQGTISPTINPEMKRSWLYQRLKVRKSESAIGRAPRWTSKPFRIRLARFRQGIRGFAFPVRGNLSTFDSTCSQASLGQKAQAGLENLLGSHGANHIRSEISPWPRARLKADIANESRRADNAAHRKILVFAVQSITSTVCQI